MNLATLKKDLYSAQKEQNTQKVAVLRYLIAGVQNKEIELRSNGVELQDKHVDKVILKQLKERQDSIDSYKQGGRDDLVQKEQAELAILAAYAPAPDQTE